MDFDGETASGKMPDRQHLPTARPIKMCIKPSPRIFPHASKIAMFPFLWGQMFFLRGSGFEWL